MKSTALALVRTGLGTDTHSTVACLHVNGHPGHEPRNEMLYGKCLQDALGAIRTEVADSTAPASDEVCLAVLSLMTAAVSITLHSFRTNFKN